MRRVLSTSAALILAANLASADVITSTEEGGPWSAGTTWIGGVAPGAGDDVVIAGPVQVSGTAPCLSVDVLAPGVLSGGASGTARLDVGGSVHNGGAIQGGPLAFDLSIGGDFSNDGVWTVNDVIFTGSENHALSMGAGALLEASLVLDEAATGDMIVGTPLEVRGSIDTVSGRMILQPNSPLTARQSWIDGEILCGGNELRLDTSAVLSCAVDAAVLVGVVQATSQAEFTGGLTVKDTLQNNPSGGSAVISVEGGLTNDGLIRNKTYGLTINLSGNLTNNGAITCSQVALDGVNDHHLSMGPEGDIATTLFLPEFGAGTIIAETPVHVSGGISLGLGGQMILSTGSSLHLTGTGSITGGTLLAAGNDIRMDGTGFLGGVAVDGGAVLRGRVQVQGNTSFSGGLTVADTLQNWEFAADEITVEGTLVNQGLIRDNVQTLSIIAAGDVANLGGWENSRVVLNGAEDQDVGAGGGIGVPEFVLDSGLDAATYQWFRDGVPIEGEILPELALNTVGEADYGTYHCEGDGEPSRSFVISEGEIVTAPPAPVAAALVLEQNRPNPFRPSTEIAFRIAEAGPVRLAVYDVAGRKVSVLIDGDLPAGRHVVGWRPDNLARGVFFYRLSAGGREIVRKATRSW